MADNYGSDYLTIVDEDGTEFELEVLSKYAKSIKEIAQSRFTAVQ